MYNISKDIDYRNICRSCKIRNRFHPGEIDFENPKPLSELEILFSDGDIQ